MKSKLDELRADRNAIIEIASRHKAFNVAVFGNILTSSSPEKCEIDFIVDFLPTASLLDEAGLEDDLAEYLENPVALIGRDILVQRNANPALVAEAKAQVSI